MKMKRIEVKIVYEDDGAVTSVWTPFEERISQDSQTIERVKSSAIKIKKMSFDPVVWFKNVINYHHEHYLNDKEAV